MSEPGGIRSKNADMSSDKEGESVKATLILIFSVNTNHESVAYRSFSSSKFEGRGARKVTTGITGLWQPSVHSDVAF